MIKSNHPLRGTCYVLTEALYYNGGKEAGLRPYRATWAGVSHWWLQDKQGQVTDLTADQFTVPFPYQQGKPAWFLTQEPCKRTIKLLKVLKEIRK